MRRTTVYIDGFNLYHAIDDLKKPHLKWVDLHALGESLLREGEVLAAVKYFSAFATWMPSSHAKHRAFVDALRLRGVETFMAQFKEKPRSCRMCKSTWIAHEEKETDVQIAVHMVADAMSSEVDRLIAITADTDLTPAIRMIAARRPACEVFVAAPPKRFGKCRSLRPAMEITPGRIAAHLLPAELLTADGRTIARPPTYAPPT